LASIHAAATVRVEHAQLCSPPFCAHRIKFRRIVNNSRCLVFNHSRLVHVQYLPVDFDFFIIPPRIFKQLSAVEDDTWCEGAHSSETPFRHRSCR